MIACVVNLCPATHFWSIQSFFFFCTENGSWQQQQQQKSRPEKFVR